MARLRIAEIGGADVDAVVALWTACGLVRPWNDPHAEIDFARSVELSPMW